MVLLGNLLGPQVFLDRHRIVGPTLNCWIIGYNHTLHPGEKKKLDTYLIQYSILLPAVYILLKSICWGLIHVYANFFLNPPIRQENI